MSGDGGNVEITARDVTEGSALADFNFFVVHSATGRGLYQHYYHSCTANITSLCKLLVNATP